MSDASPSAPIESMAALRSELGAAKTPEPGTAAVGGFVVAMLLALPLGVWLGTDAGAAGGILAGLGWWLLLAIGLVIVSMGTGDSKTHRSAGLTLLIGGLLAGASWFLLYGQDGWALPAILSVAGPVGGLMAWRSEARSQTEAEANPPLGLSHETVAALLALPESLAGALGPMLDRAVADVQAVDRLADNGMLEASGHSVVALQGDIDRAMRTLARRALVADTMLRRTDGSPADPVVEGMQRIADELHNLTDAALVAAASSESGGASLAEHIANLRLSTEGQAELNAALGEG